jgi:hypothetical protein
MSSNLSNENYSTMNRPSQGRFHIATWQIVLGVVLGLALTGLFIAGILWLASNHAPTIEALRDILIIVLALEFCLFGIVLIMLLIMVVRLVTLLEFEIKPILEKTDETVSTIRGTTSFVSQNVVKPVTKAGAYMSGFKAGWQALFGNPKRNLPDK